MSLADIFKNRCILYFCPHCGRIKKLGKWVILTTEESQKLSSRFKCYDLVEVICKFCDTEKTLGI